MNTLLICSLVAIADTVTSLPRDKRDTSAPAVITQDTYTAAVLHHAFVRPESSVTSRAQAVAAMGRNLDVYEQQATLAAEKNVDILVFPEYGLYDYGQTRQRTFPFLENIPDPDSVEWNPCTDPDTYPDTEVQNRLSCIARNNSLYVVANMGDKQNCSNESCSSNDSYQYNTNVVYDPTGLLISRYHKSNLYGEYAFNFPPVELRTFDTPFGRFANIISMDTLFHEPAVSVIESYHVDSVACPLLWGNFLPLLSPFQWQAGFAAGMKVNLLAANVRSYGGSGVYTPTGPAAYTASREPFSYPGEYPPPLKPAGLVIATIPSRPTVFSASNKTVNIPGPSSNENEFRVSMFYDEYNFVELEGDNGSATVCHGSHCCQANYSKSASTIGGEAFALGAFAGRHVVGASAGIEMCVLVNCGDPDYRMCDYGSFYSKTNFTRLTLSGNFSSTTYVFPEVLVDGSEFERSLPSGGWSFNGKVLDSENGFSRPLMSAVLIGRDYTNDPTYPTRYM